MYKDGKVFFYCPPDGKPAELTVMWAAGPLCVGRVFDHGNRKEVEGLYWIYLRKHGAKIGPFFADIVLAAAATKKMLKHFGPAPFEQPLPWIARQSAIKEWIERNIGKAEDLIGAEWIKD